MAAKPANQIGDRKPHTRIWEGKERKEQESFKNCGDKIRMKELRKKKKIQIYVFFCSNQLARAEFAREEQEIN